MTNLINPIEMFWMAKKCGYCRENFTQEDQQKENYHAWTFTSIHLSGILVMLFHKKCWTKFDDGCKTAWQQIQNDPIYRWS